MYYIQTLSQGASLRFDDCPRCRLYGESYHRRDVVTVPVSAPSMMPIRELIAPEQLASLARWTNKRESEIKTMKYRASGRYGR